MSLSRRGKVLHKSHQLKEALIRSEERLKFALEGSGDGLWDWDVQTNEIFFSTQWKEMIGFCEHEIPNSLDEWEKRIHPDDEERVMREVQHHLRGETLFYLCEYRIRCKDGTYKWILDRGKVTARTDSGEPLRMVGTHTDVTGRRQMEDALRESRQRYVAIFDQSPIAIGFCNAEGGLEITNRAFLDLFGVAGQEDVTGYGLFDNLDVTTDAKQRLLKWEAVRFEYDLDFDRAKGSVLPRTAKEGVRRLDISIAPLKDGAGISGYLVQIQDITDRTQAEAALRQSEINFSAFFNTIRDFLFVLDMGGNIILVNDTVTGRLGYAREDLVGRSIVMLHPPEVRAEATKALQDLLHGSRADCSFPLVAGDGRTVPVEAEVVRGVWNGQGVLFGVVRDVSELKVSEEKFFKTFHTAASLMMLSTFEEGRFIDVNEAFLATLGYSREEVIGRTSADLDIFFDESQRHALRRDVAEKGEARNREVTVRAKDGSARIALCSSSAFRVQDTSYLLVTANDITELKRLEEALNEQVHFLQMLIDTIPNPIFFKDAKGRYLGCNKAFEIYHAIPLADLLGKSAYDIRPMDEAERHHEAEMELIENGGSATYEYLFAHPDGTMRNVIDSKACFTRPDGTIGGIAGVIMDITERKRVEVRLKESEERYRTAIEYSNDGVVMVRNGVYLYVSQRFLDMFGYASRREVLDRPLTIVVHPDDRERVADMHAKRQKGESVPARYEFKGIKKNGEPIFIDVSVAGTVYNNEEVFLAYMRDVTDRKRMEEEKLYSAKLESALEMAGAVCHELNQPLQVIASYADILLMTEGTRDGRAVEKLEAIKEQTRRMGAMTKKLMGIRQYSTRDYIGTTRIIDIDATPDDS